MKATSTFNRTQIDNDFTIRLRRFNGYSRSGRAKYCNRKTLTASKCAAIFGGEKVQWWYDKAIKDLKPYRFTKKEHYVIDFYPRYVR